MPDAAQVFRRVYLDTTYGPAGARFRLTPQFALAPEWTRGGRRWAILTAWNPGSVMRDAATNRAAQTSLEEEIRQGQYHFVPAWNGADEWREDSVLVWDIPLANAAALGQIYGQNAVVWGMGKRAALVWPAHGVRLDRFWTTEVRDDPKPSRYTPPQ